MMMKKYRIFPGWQIVATGFLMMALQFAPAVNLIGLFVPLLEQEFSASRTAVVTSTTIMIFSGMAGTLCAGKILSRFDMRRVVCLTLLISCVSNIGYALAPSLGVMYLVSVVRGAIGPFTHVMPISILVTNWFAPSLRGRATGIAMVGSGVGFFVLTPIVSYILHHHGWRCGYLLFAAFGLVLIPLVWRTIRRSPQELGLMPLGAPPAAESGRAAAPQGVPAKQALKSPAFWFMAAAFVLLNGICQTWNNNGASFLGDIGLDVPTASALLSATAAGIIAGKLFLGFICDRKGARFSTSLGVCFLLLGYISAAAIGPHLLAGGAVAVLMGLGIASSSVSTPLITAELFGGRDFGVLVGYLGMCANLGASLVPLLLTALYDRLGNFIPSWYLAAGIAVLTAFLIHFAYTAARRHPQ